MNFSTRMTKTVAVGLLASMAMLTIAPLAEAGNKRHRHSRYKGVSCESSHRVHRSQWRVVHDRHSHAAPVIAGVLGGIILGTAISNARTEPVIVRERVVVREHPQRYFDPYCETWYDDLDECRYSMRDHRHPMVVQLIDTRRDQCVETYRWHRGDWDRLGRDWDGWDD